MERLREDQQQHYHEDLLYYGLGDPPQATLQRTFEPTAPAHDDDQEGYDSEGSMTAADLMHQYHKIPFLDMVQQGAPPGSFQLLLRMQDQQLQRTAPEARLYGAETDDGPAAALPPSSLELDSCVTHVSEELLSEVCREKVATLTANVSAPAPVVKRRTRKVVRSYGDDEVVATSMEGGAKRNKKSVERKKRKRNRVSTNKREEELESQRMSHIAVERNRRRLMNEHLAALRALMPPYYIQRGDQASIVGGAIEFVKELEQHLQTLLAEKHKRQPSSTTWTSHHHRHTRCRGPFHEFFISPQYRTLPSPSVDMEEDPEHESETNPADIEAAVTQTHVNLRVLVPRRPGQLLRFIATLEDMRLTVLHLNISSFHDYALYSFNLKMEDDCKLGSGDEIAAAVNQIFSYIAFTTGYS